MKVFEYLRIPNVDGTEVILDGQSLPATIGKHAVWIPPVKDGEMGMKVIWTINGSIESIRDWDKGRNAEKILAGVFGGDGFAPTAMKSISNEYHLMKLFSEEGMAPPVGELFFIKNLLSTVPFGGLHNDPIGAYGYYLADARTIPPGKFDIKLFEERFLDTEKVTMSKGAVGDVKKADNILNGYLVDVRRSLFDMMSLTKIPRIPERYLEDVEALKRRIQELGQFPAHERRTNYQSYFLQGEYIEGSRDTEYRMKQYQVPENLEGQTVLDLGCCHGAIPIECYRRGARRITGMDYNREYIDVARSLARANGFPINFIPFDLTDVVGLREFAEQYYNRKVDVVFALSLYKHIPEHFGQVMTACDWKTLYVESNNAPDGEETGHVKAMLGILKAIPGVTVDYSGSTGDRSPRLFWRLKRG